MTDRLIKVTYTCDVRHTTTGGMIDAGPGPVQAHHDKYTGTLHLKGPQIDYSVERVKTYILEEVDA